jgi:hypothetical protein
LKRHRAKNSRRNTRLELGREQGVRHTPPTQKHQAPQEDCGFALGAESMSCGENSRAARQLLPSADKGIRREKLGPVIAM